MLESSGDSTLRRWENRTGTPIHVWFAPKWVIRTNARGSVERQVQEAIASVDPQLPIAPFQTIDDLRGRVTLDQRYNAALFSALAGLALLLGALGLSGLIGQSVTQRTHELGVRMALGASARKAMFTMMRPGLAPIPFITSPAA